MKSQQLHGLRYAFGLLALGALALAPDTYAATDSTIVPATVCQPLVDLDASATEAQKIHDNIRYHVNGSVHNSSYTERLTVVCPILRNTIARPLNYVRVYAVDNFPGPGLKDQGVFHCTLSSNSRWGHSAVAEESLPMNENPTGPIYFWNIDKADTDGSYTLTCDIPPKPGVGLSSWIGSIVIEEP